MTNEMNKIHELPARFRKLVKRFSDNSSGTAAIEFSFVAPLFVTIFLGFAAMAEGQNKSNSVALVAATVGDVIARSPSLTKQQISDAMLAGQAIAGSSSNTLMKIQVVGVEVDDNEVATVAWVRRTSNWNSGATVGATYNLPADMRSEPGFVVASRAKYAFVPTVGKSFIPKINMKSDFYFVPRVSDATLCDDCHLPD